MCNFLSYIEKDDKLYYLTDQDIFSEYGKEKLKGCRDNDFIGHGATRQFYDLRGGIDHEIKDFWNLKQFPKEIADKLEKFEYYFGRIFRTYLTNLDLRYIVYCGTPKYKDLAWKQLLKQSPTNNDLGYIIEYGIPKYKDLACKQLLKQSPTNYDLTYIIKYGTPKYKDLAEKELNKRR